MKNEELDQQIISIVVKDDGSFNSSKIKKSYIVNHFPELYDYLKQRYDDIEIKEATWIKEVIYRIVNHIDNQVACPVCGKPITFDGRRYPIYCSIDCKKSDKGKQLMKQKTIKTCLEKYGVESTSAAETTKETRKKNCLEKYGVEHHNKVKEISQKISQTYKEKTKEEKEEIVKRQKETTLKRYGDINYRNIELSKKTKLEKYGDENYNNIEKIKETCLSRYGVEHIWMLDKIQQKIQEACLERYGVKYIGQSQDQKEKSRQTCLSKYGEIFALKSEQIREKIRNTCKEKYGVNSPLECEEIKEKIKNTLMERYGVDHPWSSPIIRSELKQTLIQKYGVDNGWKSSIIREHCKQTCKERYGVDNPMQNKDIMLKTWETKKQNGTINSSKIEKQLIDYFVIRKIKFFHNYSKDPRYPFHVDFYLVDYDLFIEIQGLWTHGGHPYDPECKEDQEKLEGWKQKNTKYYNNAIKVWTISDPLKREIAKKNNINYLEIFNCNVYEAINEIQCRMLNNE